MIINFGFIFNFVLAFFPSKHMYTLVVSFNRLRFFYVCLVFTSISSFECSMWRVHTNNHQMCQYLLLELTSWFSCVLASGLSFFYTVYVLTVRFFIIFFHAFFAQSNFQVCIFVLILLCSVNATSEEFCTFKNHLNLGQIDTATSDLISLSHKQPKNDSIYSLWAHRPKKITFFKLFSRSSTQLYV